MATRLMCKTLGAACLGLSMALSAPTVFALADIIETPSRPTALAPEHLLNDVDTAGERIVAAGVRGHIIFPMMMVKVGCRVKFRYRSH